jgi:hypothetical protein
MRQTTQNVFHLRRRIGVGYQVSGVRPRSETRHPTPGTRHLPLPLCLETGLLLGLGITWIVNHF